MVWTPIKTQPGVVRLATPYDIPNVWWDTNNVRWVAGAMCPIGGNSRISSSVMPSPVRKIFQWRDNGANTWTVVGMENGVRVEYGGYFDVTPSSFIGISGIGGGGYGTGVYGQPEVLSPTSAIDDPSGTTTAGSNAVTITNASPAVVTWNSHPLTIESVVKFTTTGSLPTGLTAGTAYWVVNPTTNTFQVATTKGGTAINTSSAGSGTHTANWIVGKDTYGRQKSTNPPQFRKPDFWSFATFGQDLLAVCSSDGRLLHFAPTAGTPSAMDVPTNAPTSNKAVVVTAERSCMLLGAAGVARRIAWSDFENYNGWTFNTATGQAGYIDIEATSPIVSGIRVKEGVLVLTQHEAFLVRYVGAPYFYGVEKLGSTTFAAPNAIAIGGNQVMWFGDECFWMYDGSAVRPVDCPFFNDLKQDYNPIYGNYRAHMHENGMFPEFWFDYPDQTQTDGECNHAVIYNYAEKWWSRTARNVTASCGAQTAKYPVGSKTDKYIYQFEDGWTDAGVTRVGSVWAETSHLPFSQNGGLVDINQAMVSTDPQYGSQNYQIKLLSRFTMDQDETTFGPYIPRTDGYTDTRASGRDYRLRIEATDDNYWSIGQVRVDVSSSGGER